MNNIQENRLIFNGLRLAECVRSKNATFDCNAFFNSSRQQCVSDTKNCLQHLKNKKELQADSKSVYANPEKQGLVEFGLADLLAGAVIRGGIVSIQLLKYIPGGKSTIRVVSNAGNRVGVILSSTYNTAIRPLLSSTGKIIKKPFKKPIAITRAKNINNIRAANQAALHAERYTLAGIQGRIKREGLQIIKNKDPSSSFAGYDEYFFSGNNGAVMFVKAKVENGAVKMNMPRSVGGGGYSTALYFAMSQYFKTPIIMSKNLTSNVYDDAGNLVKRGGKYIWEELKKIEGGYVQYDTATGRTFFTPPI